MDSSQILNIKKYVEGAYPNLKKDSDADVVWLDVLKKYSYKGIMAAVKDYIETGNKFPPTVAQLILGYKNVLEKLDEQILNEMISDGFFDDQEDADEEIADWNKTNRINNTIFLLTNRPKHTWPNFLREEFEKHQNKYIEYGGNSNVKRISRTENVNQERLT